MQHAATTEPGPLRTLEDSAQAIARLNTIIDRLEAVVAEETVHARAGRLTAAIGFDEEKSALSLQFARESTRLRAAGKMVSDSLPDSLSRLQARHESLRQLLQINLTVLATAQSVSEGIIRGVSGEIARKHSPSTYGANGKSTPPSPRDAQPLSVSRSL